MQRHSTRGSIPPQRLTELQGVRLGDVERVVDEVEAPKAGGGERADVLRDLPRAGASGCAGPGCAPSSSTSSRSGSRAGSGPESRDPRGPGRPPRAARRPTAGASPGPPRTTAPRLPSAPPRGRRGGRTGRVPPGAARGAPERRPRRRRPRRSRRRGSEGRRRGRWCSRRRRGRPGRPCSSGTPRPRAGPGRGGSAGLSRLVVDVAHRDADHVGREVAHGAVDGRDRVGLREEVEERHLVPGAPRRGRHQPQPERDRDHVDPLGVGRDEQHPHRPRS